MSTILQTIIPTPDSCCGPDYHFSESIPYKAPPITLDTIWAIHEHVPSTRSLQLAVIDCRVQDAQLGAMEMDQKMRKALQLLLFLCQLSSFAFVEEGFRTQA